MLLLATFLIFILHNGIAKKFVVEVDNVEACPGNEHFEAPVRNLFYHRFNKTHKGIDFDITFKNPLDKNVGVAAHIDAWGVSGWLTLPILPLQENLCRFLKTIFPGIWVSFLKAVGVKEPNKCPVPAGKYSLRNFVIDTSMIKMAVWEGKYRFKLEFIRMDNKKIVSCFLIPNHIDEVPS